MGELSRSDPADVALGERIRGLRRRRGLTQADLATEVGVTFQQIQKYERGANRVSASMLGKIARALESSMADLFDETPVTPDLRAIEDLLREPGALDLLAAYRRMPQGPSRAKLVAFVESLVD